MMRRYVVVTALALLAASACQPVPEAQSREVPDELAQYVLKDVPPDVERSTFIDFEGKVHLVGYEIAPPGPVAPGDRLELTFYWRSVSPLGPGWSLFTHLIDDHGLQIENKVRGDGGFDNIGPLRKRSAPEADQAFPPSLWSPGKIYKDVQAFRLPRTVRSTSVSVLVGIGRNLPCTPTDAEEPEPADTEGAAGAGPVELPSPGIRLAVVSGPSDGNNAGFIAHLKTTWKPSDEPDKHDHARPNRRRHDRARRGSSDNRGDRARDRRTRPGDVPDPMRHGRPARPSGPLRGAPAAPPSPPAPPAR